MAQHSESLQSSNKPEVVTFGETMALFISGSSKGIEYSTNMEKSFGGAESNVAIGLARLGHNVGWFGTLGNDPLGRMIFKKLRGEGVDVSKVQFSNEAPTGLMLREELAGKASVYYYRKNSAASQMQPEQIDASYISQAKILHITGITPALSSSCFDSVLEAIRIAKANGVKVCFDPNLRLKLWKLEEARTVLLKLAEEADYFLPGLDELKLLYQTDDFGTIVDQLRQLSAISVVKGGNNETYLIDKDQVTSVPYFKAERVVDTIGAGDGFCSGFISGILRGYELREAVQLGNLIGSLVVQMVGDWEGLPTWGEVESKLNNEAHVER
ncbi:sugar kinase [Cohnella abietis]|uniref:2-dehydro-3-deoxygluconokinase n=1 Tax=Cohnella abietis TaxID=2507935 RepID=A0A3T1D4B6_9BACL|nr:sugar kinase [Cohnella abietis]BBI32859.1 2-dehydro-3-deoxygluconokinase [Cohnella abietis]